MCVRCKDDSGSVRVNTFKDTCVVSRQSASTFEYGNSWQSHQPVLWSTYCRKYYCGFLGMMQIMIKPRYKAARTPTFLQSCLSTDAEKVIFKKVLTDVDTGQ